MSIGHTLRGGGAGGSIREAGGAFGKMEAAHEEQYFRQLQAEQLETLHQHHVDEIAFLEKEVKEQEEEIARHKKKIQDLKKMQEDAASIPK